MANFAKIMNICLQCITMPPVIQRTLHPVKNAFSRRQETVSNDTFVWHIYVIYHLVIVV